MAGRAGQRLGGPPAAGKQASTDTDSNVTDNDTADGDDSVREPRRGPDAPSNKPSDAAMGHGLSLGDAFTGGPHSKPKPRKDASMMCRPEPRVQ